MQRSVVQNLPSSAGAKPLVGTGDFSFDINLSVSILIKAESRTNAATLILHIRYPFSGQRFPRLRFPDNANEYQDSECDQTVGKELHPIAGHTAYLLPLF